MKIALCFFGYFGKKNIERKLQQLNGHLLEEYNELWSINYFKKNIIDNNDVDVFFHCWNEEEETKKLLLNEYNPKKYLFETQDEVNVIFKSINNRFYSEKKSIDLMIEYSQKNSINYDFVFLSIFDQIFFTKINFNELNNDYIYNSHWNSYGEKNNKNISRNVGFYEQWYISSPQNILKISNYEEIMNMYNKYPPKKYGSHLQRYKVIEKCNLLDKIKFIFYIGFDHIKMNQIFLTQYEHCLNKLKRKRIAIMYYGIHQGQCFNESFLNFKKMCLDNNLNYEIDIFIHRWVEDDNTKNWLPWYNSDKINKKSFEIDFNFLNNIVKPKKIICEPPVDFTKMEYHSVLGNNYIYKYNQLYNTKTNKYVIYNFLSRSLSIYKVNQMRKEYEKNMSIKYDLVLLQESYNYLFEQLDFDIFYNNKLNILGYWDFNKKIPDFFNHPSSGHLQIPSIYDIIVISNNKLIDQYCNLFFKIKKYIEEPIPVCSYKSFNYHKAEYVIYRYLIDSKIQFEKINLLSGVIRNNKVKVMLSICPEDKINYVNDLKRNDFVLSDDARDYITF